MFGGGGNLNPAAKLGAPTTLLDNEADAHPEALKRDRNKQSIISQRI